MNIDSETHELVHMHGNLWEAIVKASHKEPAYEQLARELGRSACLSYQEIGIVPSDKGWVIIINACNEDGEVEILIPKDRKEPVQILKDTRATSEYYDRYDNE